MSTHPTENETQHTSLLANAQTLTKLLSMGLPTIHKHDATVVPPRDELKSRRSAARKQQPTTSKPQ